MHVLAVRVCRGQLRAEEAVERRELLDNVRREREVWLAVVADRERIARRTEEAVHLPAVHLGPPPVPRMVRVQEGTALVVAGEPMGHVCLAVRVGEVQPGLSSVGVRKPPEVMVERAVLHAQYDDVVEPAVCRVRQLTRWHVAVRESV